MTCHADAVAWKAKYDPHETLLKACWNDIGFEPGDFMSVGMVPKKVEWLNRCSNDSRVCGLFGYKG